MLNLNNPCIWKVKSFHELTIQELYSIIKARIAVFVIEQNCPYPDLDDTDQHALHLWAENEKGEILAYCRLFDQGIKYKECSIGRVITTDKARGTGLGKTMMTLAIQLIENRFSTPEIRISAQDYLLEFYGALGFMATSKKYLEDNIPHTEMHRGVKG